MAEQPPHAALTPEGVRAGAPAALAVLVDRRGPAVLAFCEAVCDAADAAAACAEAFARFRGAVAATTDARALDPDALLLSATRHAAASRARVTEAQTQTPSRLGRLLHRHDDPTACAQVPELLVARAEGSLGAADAERLVAHLRADAGCRGVEAAFDAAEAAFAVPPTTPLPLEVLSDVLAAMVAVAPVTAEPEAFDEAPVVVPPATSATTAADPAPTPPPGSDDDQPGGSASATPATAPARRGASSSTPVGLRRTPPPPAAAPRDEPEPDGDAGAAQLTADEPTLERPAAALGRLRLRRRHGPLFDVVLPLGLVGVAAAAVLAVSGVFGGSSGASPREASAPPVVAAPAVSEATATSASEAAARRTAVARLERDRERRERRALRATREAEAAVAAPGTTP